VKRIPLILGAFLLASPAWAHHPLGGMPMETLSHGVLSGLAHPVLGFDHLFFVIAVGLAAGALGRAFSGPLAYVLAMAAGCGIGAIDGPLPLQELAIALSLLALGAVLALGRLRYSPLLFVGFGLFHGSAFAGALAGVEASASLPVLTGYLAGLVAVQFAIASGVALMTQGRKITLAGAAVAGVGVFLTLEQIEAPLLALVAG
tara:strand:+ start:435 stop:1043 length:609 start_codon:yes stop_codon:yes gene_type:complete